MVFIYLFCLFIYFCCCIRRQRTTHQPNQQRLDWPPGGHRWAKMVRTNWREATRGFLSVAVARSRAGNSSSSGRTFAGKKAPPVKNCLLRLSYLCISYLLDVSGELWKKSLQPNGFALKLRFCMKLIMGIASFSPWNMADTFNMKLSGAGRCRQNLLCKIILSALIAS